MTPETNYLFVYGTLRSDFDHPAYNYIRPYFDCLGKAQVKGLVFDMGAYPAAVPTNEEKFITGELYHLRNTDEFEWAFAQLDDYEGLVCEKDELQLYKRELVTVYHPDKTYTAWIYWFNQDVSDKPVITSGDVWQYHQQKNFNSPA